MSAHVSNRRTENPSVELKPDDEIFGSMERMILDNDRRFLYLFVIVGCGQAYCLLMLAVDRGAPAWTRKRATPWVFVTHDSESDIGKGGENSDIDCDSEM